jgi:hypothetical protein
MHEPQVIGDATVAIDGATTRPWLQSADLILGETPSLATGTRWIAEVFAHYPGCVIAGARQVDGRWLLVAVRNGQRLTVHVPAGLSHRDLEAAARDAYATWACSSCSEMSDRAPVHDVDPR